MSILKSWETNKYKKYPEVARSLPRPKNPPPLLPGVYFTPGITLFNKNTYLDIIIATTEQQ